MNKISRLNTIYYEDIRNRKIADRNILSIFRKSKSFYNMYNVKLYKINKDRIGVWRHKIECLTPHKSRSFYDEYNKSLILTFDNIREAVQFIRSLLYRYPNRFNIDVEQCFTNW